MYQNGNYSSTGASARVATAPDEFKQLTIISADRTVLQTLPDCLTNIAKQESWHCVSVNDVLRKDLTRTASHLYISELMLKEHDPNRVFERVRQLLPEDKYFALRVATAENIKFKIQQQHGAFLFPLYYAGHFLFRRVLPKLKGFRKISRLLNLPADISKAEMMGRLIYKGFSLVDVTETSQETVLIAKVDLVNNPSASKPLPNEGFLFKMQRVGERGKPITVYKFRSMHPYAEYVQEYLHQTNGIDNGGKFRNDFRVSTGGRFIRKYWLDELPMLINLFRGDIKLVGVRPISEHYFGLYPPQVQQIRRQHKPGLLPPFYADLPTTFDEIVASEVNYLQAYERLPFQTDLLYLKKILGNIILRNVRSK